MGCYIYVASHQRLERARILVPCVAGQHEQMFLLSVSLSYAPATAVPPPSAVVEHPRPRSVVGAAAAAIVVEEGRRTSDDLGLAETNP